MDLGFNPTPSWPPAPETLVPQPGLPPAPETLVPQPGRPPAPETLVRPPGWPPNPSWPPPPARAKTSGWAIASFVFGLLGGVVFSAIFGVVALRRIKRFGQRGQGLAITGLALSGAWIVLIVVIVVTGYLGSAIRSPTTGQITHSGSLSVFSLAVGDCFNIPVGATSVASVTAVPCNHAHSAQIYAEFNLTGSDQSYPGTAVVARLASSACKARTGSLDKSKVTNSMTLRFLFPEADSWLNGNRTVACMITNPTANLTSSLLNP
jgi:hypothetical protein